jgi:hypothetical protein
MAKRATITAPEITEALLQEATKIFLEQKQLEDIVRSVYTNADTKRRYAAVGKALGELQKAWKALPLQEKAWFFMLVNPSNDDSANLLLGDPTYEGVYGLCHDLESAPHKVNDRIAASYGGYRSYQRLASLGGRNTEYATTALIEFLMLHWEKVTGKNAVFVREPKGDSVTPWIESCLKQLRANGLSSIQPHYAPTWVEAVYKELRKKKKGKNPPK